MVSIHIRSCTYGHVSAGVIKVAWIYTNANLADAMINILTEENRETLFGQCTY